MWDVYEEAFIFIYLFIFCVKKKNAYKWTKHGFTTTIQVLGAAVSKEGHADNLLGHERTYYYWFPWESATVNSAFKYQLLWQTLSYLLNNSRKCVCVCVCNIYIYIHKHTLAIVGALHCNIFFLSLSWVSICNHASLSKEWSWLILVSDLCTQIHSLPQ